MDEESRIPWWVVVLAIPVYSLSNPPSLSWRTIAGHRTGGLGLDGVDLAASRSSVVVGGVAGHRTATAVVRTAIDAVDIAVSIISVFSIGQGLKPLHPEKGKRIKDKRELPDPSPSQ